MALLPVFAFGCLDRVRLLALPGAASAPRRVTRPGHPDGLSFCPPSSTIARTGTHGSPARAVRHRLVDMIGVTIIPLLPFYAEEFGASATVLGVIISAFSLAQTLPWRRCSGACPTGTGGDR